MGSPFVDRIFGFLRQHVIALLALALVVGGGAAFAAGTKLPKNSVASKQVKNNSLKGKDLKNGSVTGTDLRDGAVTGADLGDGTVTGADLANGAVEKTDLAKDAVDEVRVVYYNGGGTKTLWEETNIGKATFSLSCSPDFTINAFATGGLSPTRVGIYGFEGLNQSSEAAGTAPLVGAASVSRLGDVGMPSGGAGFGGSKFGFGQLVMFFQTPKRDVYVDLKVSLCSASGTISIDNKPEGSTITRPAPGEGTSSCTATGAAYCGRPAA
jgi:hypothetical protein